ncbi:MAG: phosphatidylserine/phosphatidylglycerophosphate/cardiolipin synthase family protein [Bdellovibrionaceae bacterium]|nr:phosphatidylserine/phosphatidylglycerophosphate/cardiolipin synthase family protein [Bdellovibrio sp.]
MNKNMTSRFLIAVTGLTLIGCSLSPKQWRGPNSTSELNGFYAEKVEIDLLKEKLQYLSAVQKNSPAKTDDQNSIMTTQSKETQIAAIRNEIAAKTKMFNERANQANPLITKTNTFEKFNRQWRKHHQTFLLHDIYQYDKPASRYYEISEAYETHLNFENQYFSYQDKTAHQTNIETGQKQFLNSQFKCEGPYQWNGKARAAGHVEKFQWHDISQSKIKTVATLTRESKECSLRFFSSEIPDGGLVAFKPSEGSFLDQFSNQFETCESTDTSQLKGPEQFFYGAENPRLTCPTEVSVFESLPKATQTIESKIEFLTGAPVPEEFWTNKNFKLSMKNAPHLDAIFISYLIFRDDFFGYSIADLLTWHAEHGTDVYIITAKVSNSDADKKLYQTLMAENPRMHVQEYAYATRDGLGTQDAFDQLHRVLHAKMFITYAKEKSSLTKAWIGGRNLGDAYAFGKDDNGQFDITNKKESVIFRDYEAVISDANFVEKIIVQYAALWNRDDETTFVRDSVLHLPTSQKTRVVQANLNQPMARHILGIPFIDEMNLEKFYVSMINSAEKEIVINTPYLNPTSKISEALINAVKRGVDVKILSMFNLKGDTAGAILTGINKTSANALLSKVKMFSYAGTNILHAKIVIIDGKLTFFGAVNLNKRSFIHDIENGVLTLSKKFAEEVRLIYDTYMEAAAPVEQNQKVEFWQKLIIKNFGKNF